MNPFSAPRLLATGLAILGVASAVACAGANHQTTVMTPDPPLRPQALGCLGQSLEYTVSRTVLAPERIIQLSCEDGLPTAVFFTAMPPTVVETDEGVEVVEELEGESDGELELTLELETWQRTWTAIEDAAADSLESCQGARSDDDLTHRLEIVDRDDETLLWCWGAALPTNWARVIEVLEEVESELAPEVLDAETEFYWPFDSDYWRDELRYHSG